MSMYVALDAGFPKSFIADYVADVDLKKTIEAERPPSLHQYDVILPRKYLH